MVHRKKRAGEIHRLRNTGLRCSLNASRKVLWRCAFCRETRRTSISRRRKGYVRSCANFLCSVELECEMRARGAGSIGWPERCRGLHVSEPLVLTVVSPFSPWNGLKTWSYKGHSNYVPGLVFSFWNPYHISSLFPDRTKFSDWLAACAVCTKSEG